jgi:hypothetical protein
MQGQTDTAAFAGIFQIFSLPQSSLFALHDSPHNKNEKGHRQPCERNVLNETDQPLHYLQLCSMSFAGR